MRAPHLLTLLFVPMLLAGCISQGESMGQTRDAPPALLLTTELRGPAGETLGTATLSQEASGTRVAASVTGLPQGIYAIHLHAVGRCDGPGFETAGGHFNPGMKQHGNLNPAGEHAGDLPNITVGADRRGRIDALRAGLRLVDGDAPLIDADGGAVLVHAKADDYRTDPAGNAGARIACGVVSRGR